VICQHQRDQIKQYLPYDGMRIVYEAQVTQASPDYTAEALSAQRAGLMSCSCSSTSTWPSPRHHLPPGQGPQPREHVLGSGQTQRQEVGALQSIVRLRAGMEAVLTLGETASKRPR
jgi:hypothetical protein